MSEMRGTGGLKTYSHEFNGGHHTTETTCHIGGHPNQGSDDDGKSSLGDEISKRNLFVNLVSGT
jgi:hypothetical protein